MTAYIRQLPADATPWRYAVEFDYSPAMVGAIKVQVPSRWRSWKPDLKAWWFKDEAIEIVRQLAMVHCDGYVHVEAQPAHRGPEDAYAALHLLPSAPPEVVQAAYRALAKKIHPDAGGNTAAMQQVNAAYQLIQRDYA